MTVYVDDYRMPARVGNVRGTWSHLTADTPAELVDFAIKLGLRPAWFQKQCRTGRCGIRDGVCRHFHFDVTDKYRRQAIALGAKSVTCLEMGAITAHRLNYYRGID